MKVEYKRDLYHNYMILAETRGNAASYGWKMVMHNQISEFLKVEERWIDNVKVYYYDISSKQPLQYLLQKGELTSEEIISLFTNILDGLERTKEYLLSGDDVVLSPEYIYTDLDSKQFYFCYYPGYGKPAQRQLTKLIENVMEKTDYNDSDAVIMIYGLYQTSKSEEYTAADLRKVLEKQKEPFHDLRKLTNEKNEEPAAERPATTAKGEESWKREQKGHFCQKENSGFVEEQQVEQEVKAYKMSMILASVFSVLAAIAIIILTVRQNFLRDEISGNISLTRLGIFLIVIGGAEVFLLNYFLSEEKKTIKVIAKKEIVDASAGWNEKKTDSFELEPTEVFKVTQSYGSGQSTFGRQNRTFQKGRDSAQNFDAVQNDVLFIDTSETGEDRNDTEGNESMDRTTVLLGKQEEGTTIQLCPKDGRVYETIGLTEFPFFIGKLKTKVDYVINVDVISRFHAKFSCEGEKYFLTDLNSTNGTYLNGSRLSPNETIEVEDGDEISFAGILYFFRKV